MLNEKDRDIFYKAMDKAQDVGDTVGGFINKNSRAFFRGAIVVVCVILFGGLLFLFSTLTKSLGKKHE